MNLTVQYFSIYLILFVFITVKQFAGPMRTIDILFVATRMRALQLIMGGDKGDGAIPVGAGPQTWAQDAMFLATWSLHVQLVMTILVPLVTGSAKPEMDEDGCVKTPEGSSKVIGLIFD